MSEKAEEPTTGFFSPVAAFYEGKTIFITGATGFMGKVDYTLAKKMSENKIKIFKGSRENCSFSNIAFFSFQCGYL